MNKRQKILENAKSLIGHTNYLMGAKWHNNSNDINKPKLLDCSGFVVWCYKMAGLIVADGTYMQWQTSQEIEKEDLKIGDIGIKEKDGIGMYNHIGIYAGDDNWIHCNYSRNGVTFEKTNVFKYYRRFKDIDFGDSDIEKNQLKDEIFKNKKQENSLIEEKDFIVNEKEMKMNCIEVDKFNFVKIQDLISTGIIKSAKYDKINKVITIIK